MTLYTTDYLEYYLTLVSWIVNNGIWSVLVASGVFAVPFLAIVIQEWLKARAEGADEGNKGVLSSARIENRVFVAIVVIMFAGIPFIDVDLNIIRYDQSRSTQCQVSVPEPTDTGWSQSFSTINNQSAKVPVWWFAMHAISRAITGASVAAIPCGTDLRQIRMDIDATRIDDPVLAQVPGGGGYPTCRQWWSDGGQGLRARLLAQVDPNLLTRLAGWAGFLSQAEVNDSVIRAVASPRQQKLNQGAVYTDYGGQIDMTLPNIVTRAASDVGLTVGSLGYFPAMDVVRQALPMVLSLLKMALVICIPLVLLIGTYDLKTVVTVSVVQFALFFTEFWFQLARWIDSTILDALYGWGWGWNRPHTNFDPLVGLNNTFGDMLLNFVMATMFLILPTFWVAALAWAGIRAGNVLQGLSTGTRDAGQAGGRGGGLMIGAAKQK